MKEGGRQVEEEGSKMETGRRVIMEGGERGEGNQVEEDCRREKEEGDM